MDESLFTTVMLWLAENTQQVLKLIQEILSWFGI